MAAPVTRLGQRDANEAEIVAALLAAGASVIRLHSPTDLLVGFREANFLLEIKLPLGVRGGLSHSKKTPAQVEFFQTWRGQKAEVRSPLEALRAIGALLH